jgi:hypothetical protein
MTECAIMKIAKPIPVPSYEEQLNGNTRWALSEGSKFFEEKSIVQDALRKITKRLGELGIPYAVVGGLALFRHGYRRFTENVDVLVTRDGLKAIHQQLDGLGGYLPPFKDSKQLRDTELGVKIEFLTTGGFPGDGKPKPVAFPDPSLVSEEHDGIRYLNLPTLIELKLASGLSNPDRIKDLSDVNELIKILDLPADFAKSLNPYVQGKYTELWQQSRTRYVTIWRGEMPAVAPKTIDELIAGIHRNNAETLSAMRQDGVTLDAPGNTRADRVRLMTTDSKVARKYDMHPESELWDDEDSGK